MLQNPIYIYTDLVRTCRYSICWNSCLQTCLCSIFFGGELWFIFYLLDPYYILLYNIYNIYTIRCPQAWLAGKPTMSFDEFSQPAMWMHKVSSFCPQYHPMKIPLSILSFFLICRIPCHPVKFIISPIIFPTPN